MHEDLEGFDINVNSLGELESNFDIEKINEFLNKNLDDKKVPDAEAEDEVVANDDEGEMEFESDEEEDKMEFEADEEWEEE